MANLKDLLVNGPSRFIGDVNITGIPTAPTAAVGTNSTQIATTAFIKNTIDSLNLGNARIYYGVCGTAAATAQKEVTCEAYTTTGDPIAGDIIYVAFNVTNSAAVADLTLKVNQSTAKGIRYQKTPQISTLPSAEYLSASNVYRFVYNGTYWVTILDTNTDSLLKVYTQTSGYSGDYPILVGSTLASALMGKSNNSTTGVYGIIYKQKAPTVNPATGLLKIPGSLTVGTSGDTNTTLQVYGATSLSGNLCPSTSGIYDLGSNSLQWKDIYGNLMGNAETTTAADLTTTVNAIAYYNDTAGTFASKPSADGALYATSANGTLQWGTLPVGQGGTGATSFTANKLLYYNGTNLSSTSNIHFDGSALIINGNTLWASEDSFEILEGSAYFAEDIYVDGDINGDLIGNVSGNAGSATKLQTARSLQVALDSTSATTFNGTADVNNIPISGTLGIDHGGTGATSFQSNKLIYCNSNDQLVASSFLKINTGSASNAFESSQLVIANTTASMGIEIRKQSNASGFHSSWQILSDNTSLNKNTNVLKLRTNSVGTNNGTYDTDIVDFNYYKVTFYKDIYGTLKGNADTATGANLTTVTNAIAYYSNTTGTFASKSSADGALYATSAGGELQWGTLPVNQGGTGNNIALTQYRPIFASTTSQMAACTNIYMNNTSLAVNVPNNSPTITSGYNFEVNGKSRFVNNIDLAADVQISRAATGTYYWNAGTTTALLYAPFKTGYYNPCISIGTTDGSWDIGSNTGSTYLNKLLFTYVPSDYSGSSRPEGAITLEPEGNIIANKFKGIADSATEAYIYNGNNRQTGLTNQLAYYADSNGTFASASRITVSGAGLLISHTPNSATQSEYNITNSDLQKSISLRLDNYYGEAGLYDSYHSGWCLKFSNDRNTSFLYSKLSAKGLIPWYVKTLSQQTTTTGRYYIAYYGASYTPNEEGWYLITVSAVVGSGNYIAWAGVLPWIKYNSSYARGYNNHLVILNDASKDPVVTGGGYQLQYYYHFADDNTGSCLIISNPSSNKTASGTNIKVTFQYITNLT